PCLEGAAVSRLHEQGGAPRGLRDRPRAAPRVRRDQRRAGGAHVRMADRVRGLRVIVCAMIVGPGEADRHLTRVLDAASKWADRLVVVADHVDPKTEAVLLSEIKLGANEAEG